jgi:hypothetical protein
MVDARSERSTDDIAEHVPAQVKANAQTSVESSQRFADGTQPRLHVQSTKSIRISTRCETLEEFIATFGRYCEDAAILVPNGRRSVGAITEFSFNLRNGRCAFAALGTVIEELTTNENRFGRPGIVIALQQLGRGSTALFSRMVAARKQASESGTVAPVFARTETAAFKVVADSIEPHVPQDARAVTIPVYAAPASAKPASAKQNVAVTSGEPTAQRATTVTGVAASTPAATARTFSIPPIRPIAPKTAPRMATQPGVASQGEAKPVIVVPEQIPIATTSSRVAPATAARPSRATSDAQRSEELLASSDAARERQIALDGVPQLLHGVNSDTERDVIPFALLHSLGNASPVLPAEPLGATIEPAAVESSADEPTQPLTARADREILDPAERSSARLVGAEPVSSTLPAERSSARLVGTEPVSSTLPAERSSARLGGAEPVSSTLIPAEPERVVAVVAVVERSNATLDVASPANRPDSAPVLAQTAAMQHDAIARPDERELTRRTGSSWRWVAASLAAAALFVASAAVTVLVNDVAVPVSLRENQSQQVAQRQSAKPARHDAPMLTVDDRTARLDERTPTVEDRAPTVEDGTPALVTDTPAPPAFVETPSSPPARIAHAAQSGAASKPSLRSKKKVAWAAKKPNAHKTPAKPIKRANKTRPKAAPSACSELTCL